MELLKDGAAGGSDRRHSREGINGPGGQRGENEGEDSAEWNGVRLRIFIYYSAKDDITLHMCESQIIVTNVNVEMSFSMAPLVSRKKPLYYVLGKMFSLFYRMAMDLCVAAAPLGRFVML